MHFSAAIITTAAFTALVSACKQKPIGDNPSGNPIGLPGLAQQVQAGTPFTITWQVCHVALIDIFNRALTVVPSSPQRLAVSPLFSFVGPLRMSFQLPVSLNQYQILAHSFGRRRHLWNQM